MYGCAKARPHDPLRVGRIIRSWSVCGIAGILRFDGFDPNDELALTRMSARLAHRGPDGSGARIDAGTPSALLAGRRLAIVDLSSHADQPFLDEAAGLTLVYNGEIFNYVELREELRGLGFSFRTETDTEVVLRAYQAWGSACVQRFNGMWAFALWNARSRELFCSRDRFGIKPFYYFADGRRFVFASEVKAVLPGLDATPPVDRAALADFLLQGWICRGPGTLLEGVLRLPAAHNLYVHGGRLRFERYWDYPEGEGLELPGAAERFAELLADSVSLRLRGDVAVGSLLSGGLDSAAILCLASRRRPGALPAFTAGFPGEPYDETRHARAAAESCAADLQEIECAGPEPFADLERIVWALDYPAFDGQVVSRWRLLRAASQRVKVVLEGQGADELLAGYVGRYFPPYLFDEAARALRGRATTGASGLLAAWREAARPDRKFALGALAAEGLPRGAIRNKLRGVYSSDHGCTEEFLAAAGDRDDPLPEGRFRDRLTNRLHFDHAVGILPMLLKMGDALSMAHSVESRLPFLDYRLVELGFSLGSRHKYRGVETKGVLRNAVRGIVPESTLARRDKVGFATPMTKWTEREMDRFVRPVLLSKRSRERGVFDPVRMERELDEFDPAARRGPAIFRRLQTELWFRLFVDGDGPSAESLRP